MARARSERRVGPAWPFWFGLGVITGAYVLLIVGMIVADTAYTSPEHMLKALSVPEIQYSIKLSLVTCSISALLALWVAVPVGYLMSRASFPGKAVIDAILDIPIVLPPLVLGISLLILFQTPVGRFIERFVDVTYAVPGVVLAQFSVGCAFAVRSMRLTFDQLPRRPEEVALTLGASRLQAFTEVALPAARRGMVGAGTLAWARSLGEFGPILVFAGTTRMKTEVLPSTVFLELSVGNLEAAVSVSLVMIAAAFLVLVVVRVFGDTGFSHDRG